MGTAPPPAAYPTNPAYPPYPGKLHDCITELNYFVTTTKAFVTSSQLFVVITRW